MLKIMDQLIVQLTKCLVYYFHLILASKLLIQSLKKSLFLLLFNEENYTFTVKSSRDFAITEKYTYILFVLIIGNPK